jgi:hypothetical protein
MMTMRMMDDDDPFLLAFLPFPLGTETKQWNTRDCLHLTSVDERYAQLVRVRDVHGIEVRITMGHQDHVKSIPIFRVGFTQAPSVMVWILNIFFQI